MNMCVCNVSGVTSPKAVLYKRNCCTQLGKAKHKEAEK